MKSGVIGGLLGSLIGILLGAAAFRTTSAVDSRFTYQGQIRNGEALVDGNIDVRFTLWDALDSGATVGSAVTKTNLPVADGRFATELDFGSSAFAGDSRWIQMEVRSPAGSGQYLALAPRQMINAVPYALYSLNGGLSPWNLDVASRDIGYTNGRVGIGTNSPTAALEVVSATTGDDAVKLPAGSIGVLEIDPDLSRVATIDLSVNTPTGGVTERAVSFICNDSMVLSLQGIVEGHGDNCDGPSLTQIFVDGNVVFQTSFWYQDAPVMPLIVCIPLSEGNHIIRLRDSNPNGVCNRASDAHVNAHISLSLGLLNLN